MWLGGGTSSDSAPTWDRGKARRAQGSPVTSCSSNKGGNGAEGSPLPHQGASGSLGLEFPPQPPTSHPHPKPLLSFKPCFTHPSSRWASPPPRSWHFLIYRGGVGGGLFPCCPGLQLSGPGVLLASTWDPPGPYGSVPIPPAASTLGSRQLWGGHSDRGGSASFGRAGPCKAFWE